MISDVPRLPAAPSCTVALVTSTYSPQSLLPRSRPHVEMRCWSMFSHWMMTHQVSALQTINVMMYLKNPFAGTPEPEKQTHNHLTCNPLNLSNLPQPAKSRTHGSGSGCARIQSVCNALVDHDTCHVDKLRVEVRVDVRDGVSTTSGGLLAALAGPDADGLSLDVVLAAESAGVLGVLGGLHLLDHLPQRGTISVIPEISLRIRDSQRILFPLRLRSRGVGRVRCRNPVLLRVRGALQRRVSFPHASSSKVSPQPTSSGLCSHPSSNHVAAIRPCQASFSQTSLVCRP